MPHTGVIHHLHVGRSSLDPLPGSDKDGAQSKGGNDRPRQLATSRRGRHQLGSVCSLRYKSGSQYRDFGNEARGRGDPEDSLSQRLIHLREMKGATMSIEGRTHSKGATKTFDAP
jgi:hypothetical protein